MKKFKYEAVESIEEAQQILKNENAVISAGFSDLAGVLKDRLLPVYPQKVVSIKNIPSLNKIEIHEDGLHIGATTTLTDIAESEIVKKHWQALGDAAYSVATPNLRNMATLGGNICQDIRCWYYRYPDSIGGRVNCARKEGHTCFATQGENRYHSIFGAMKVCQTGCQSACPAHTDVPAYMDQIRKGDLDAAAKIILQYNPFPMLTSRVCPHPCQNQCSQNEFGETVAIHCVERTVGDYILENIDKYYVAPKKLSGKKVAIIGAGPSGLAAAFQLRKSGHEVTVYDNMEKAGGVLMYGIPAYRLPKHYIEKVQDAMEKMGIRFVMKTTVGKDITVEQIREENDSLYIATGAWKQPILGLNGEELTQFGLDFLVEVNKYLKGRVGEKVLVCGGGNVAMDVALVSKRLGVKDVHMVCLEEREDMPASQEEIARALEEGVQITNGRGLVEVLYDDQTGQVKGLRSNKCLAVRDASGRFNPQYDQNDLIDIEADCIILATGQRVDLDFLGDKMKNQLSNPRGLIGVDDFYSTNLEGVFAGGDAATGPDIAIRAIGAGVQAARSMNNYMNCPNEVWSKQTGMLTFDSQAIYTAKNHKLEELPVSQRTLTDEDEKSYPKGIAKCEASRCMNCGCLAVNSSDLANMLYAYDAKIVTNKRIMDAATFFASKTKVKDILMKDEIVLEVIVPHQSKTSMAQYDKYRLRNAIDFAIVALASTIDKAEDGTINHVSLVLGAVAPIAMKCKAAEDFLIGKKIDENIAQKAADLCLEGALPLAQNQFKIDVAKTLVKRALLGIHEYGDK